jgi:hypothetical protein
MTLAPEIGCFWASMTTPPMVPVVTPCAARPIGHDAAQKARTASVRTENLRLGFINVLSRKIRVTA